MHLKNAEGIANSVDPDQTAPAGAVWSGSALFAQTCLYENLITVQTCEKAMLCLQMASELLPHLPYLF